jgi:hypothetical protein
MTDGQIPSLLGDANGHYRVSVIGNSGMLTCSYIFAKRF